MERKACKIKNTSTFTTKETVFGYEDTEADIDRTRVHDERAIQRIEVFKTFLLQSSCY